MRREGRMPVARRRPESRKEAGVVKGWQALPDGGFGCCVLSFPLCGNGLFKPLDSGLRRNDDEALDIDRQPDSLNPCLPVHK